MLNVLAVFIGGGTGALFRYLITQLSTKLIGLSYTGTFCANIIGCFIIGYVFGITLQKAESISPVLKLFITTGFLGGLTTFSTFALESICFLKDGKWIHFAIYILASIILGLTAAYSGFMLTK